MPPYSENQVVRLLAPVQGDDPFDGAFVSARAGEEGTVLAVAPDGESYLVEFVRPDGDGWPVCNVLDLAAGYLEAAQ